MVAYIRGNLAVDERKMRRTNNQEQRRPSSRKKASIPPQEKLLYIVTIVVCLILAGLIVFNESRIYDLSNQKKTIEQDMKQYNDDISKSMLERSNLSNLEQMRKVGEANGMQIAQDNDVIKIRLKENATLNTHEMADAR